VVTFHIESRFAEALLLLQFKASQAERVAICRSIGST
jgi:hypothetical protein